MKTANIKSIPAIVAIDFPHGYEAIPTSVNGLPVQYVTVDAEGIVQAWNALPKFDADFQGGAWGGQIEDVVIAGTVDDLPGGVYPGAANSLRRVNLGKLVNG